MAVTKAQAVAAIQTIAAVAEAIRELGSVPSGHLYARLMATGMTLQTYQSIVDKLVQAGLVYERNHLLTWVVDPPYSTNAYNLNKQHREAE